MANTYSNRLVLIRYHWYYPDNTDPYYQYNISENMSRNSYYTNNYSPHLLIDGNIDGQSNSGSWGASISSELAVSSPLDIDINGEYNRTAHTGHADVRIIATAPITNTNLKVRIGIIESNISRTSPNGTQIHNQTFRDMTPNTTGISLTIAQGDTVNLAQSFSCPSPMVQSNCELVVFVQSDTGHRILQGAKRNVMTMTYYLSPFTLISPPNHDTLESCPTNLVWHRSIDADSGYAVRYLAYIGYTPDFSAMLIASDTLSDTTWAPGICPAGDTTYYWKVVALNGHAENRQCDQVFNYVIREAPGPGPFSLIYPPNGDTVVTCTTTCVWHRSIDPTPGHTVSYQVSLSYSPDFETVFLSSDTLSDTTWATGVCLPNDTSYYWQVAAFNDAGQRVYCNAPFSFMIKEPAYNYIPGNVNDQGGFTGLDVVYAVSFLKGGPPPPYSAECPPGSGRVWYLAGDVNGSCSFTGLDVSYMVAFLKGGPALVPCPTCLPGRR